MPRTPSEVPAAELAVLQILWRAGPSTVRELAEELYGAAGPSAAATVQKLCERLAGKGFVGAERGARPYRYRARVGRQELIGRELESLAEKLCEGSFEPLISHLMERAPLSAEELRSLRERLEAGLGEGARERRARRPG